MVGICLFYIYSLVENLKAGLTHTHLLLNAKFGNGRVLRRALPTENLPTCPAVVLNEEPPAVMHQKIDFYVVLHKRNIDRWSKKQYVPFGS